MKNLATRLTNKIVIYLSHRPKLYALVVSFGVILFWRGIWHGADHLFMNYNGGLSTIDTLSPWWDSLASFIVGGVILYFTGAFISSFIGNELILSGLRGEKKLNEKTESEVKNEVRAVSDIQDMLAALTVQVDQLEKKVHNHDHS